MNDSTKVSGKYRAIESGSRIEVQAGALQGLSVLVTETRPDGRVLVQVQKGVYAELSLEHLALNRNGD